MLIWGVKRVFGAENTVSAKALRLELDWRVVSAVAEWSEVEVRGVEVKGLRGRREGNGSGHQET